MKAVPLNGSIGLELQDLDMSKPFDPAEIATLRDSFDTGGVLLVRGHRLADEDQDRFVATLGELHTFRWGSTVEYLSNVMENNPSLAGSRRLLFHNDGAYRDDVAAGTCLYAQDVSPTSPPTAFANTVRAYENLPDELKARIEGLHAYNMFDPGAKDPEQKRVRLSAYPKDADLSAVQAAEHPIVITAPHTGRKALFVNEFNTSHIVEYGPHSEEGEEPPADALRRAVRRVQHLHPPLRERRPRAVQQPNRPARPHRPDRPQSAHVAPARSQVPELVRLLVAAQESRPGSRGPREVRELTWQTTPATPGSGFACATGGK